MHRMPATYGSKQPFFWWFLEILSYLCLFLLLEGMDRGKEGLEWRRRAREHEILGAFVGWVFAQFRRFFAAFVCGGWEIVRAHV